MPRPISKTSRNASPSSSKLSQRRHRAKGARRATAGILERAANALPQRRILTRYGHSLGAGLPAALVALAIAAGACIQDDGKRWHPLRRLELVSTDDERELGMEFDSEIAKHARVFSDPYITAFISDLGQRVLQGVDPQTYIYRFRVVQADSLNAFAVPGGYIYFHSGTILQAGSIDELAGVMGHEIAHVTARHYAHRVQEKQIRSLLTTIPLIAASVAADQPGVMMTGMALNVAVDLQFSREDEAESDRLGAIYVTRAGFDAGASAFFFERILEESKKYPNDIPPYLFSHPAVEERIAEVRQRAESLTPVFNRSRDLDDRFERVQARLAYLIAQDRLELPGPGTLADHSANDAAVAQALERSRHGDTSAALAALADLASGDPNDPQIPFEIGNLLSDQGRLAGAISAYRRSAELDSSHALVFYRLGLAYKRSGDKQRAVYALEQAVQRSGPKSAVRNQSRWEIVKLTFGVVSESGFADGNLASESETPAGKTVRFYDPATTRLAWWGRVSPPLLGDVEKIQLRWRSPSGEIGFSGRPESVARVYLRSMLDLDQVAGPHPGKWRVEVLLEDEVVHRDEVSVLE